MLGVRSVGSPEASIPDAAGLVFACLGIALARPGSAVAVSVFMNAIAAGPGWRTWPSGPCPRSPTPWPPTPSSALSAPGSPPQHLADEAATPLALLGGLILWPLRLAQAPVSTAPRR